MLQAVSVSFTPLSAMQGLNPKRKLRKNMFPIFQLKSVWFNRYISESPNVTAIEAFDFFIPNP